MCIRNSCHKKKNKFLLKRICDFILLIQFYLLVFIYRERKIHNKSIHNWLDFAVAIKLKILKKKKIHLTSDLISSPVQRFTFALIHHSDIIIFSNPIPQIKEVSHLLSFAPFEFIQPTSLQICVLSFRYNFFAKNKKVVNKKLLLNMFVYYLSINFK